MKTKLTAILSAFLLCAWGPCSTLTTQQQAILTTAEGLARVAVTAAATTYGGPMGGTLAAAGLDALGTVLQGYIGKTVPPAIVQATPGVKGVGPAVLPLVDTSKPITQTDVDTFYRAATLALNTWAAKR